uniref:Uncharacterized protein n=1 Tax=Tanacetum cinerariifolium TaxID=118510 RepID=A0A6L2P3U6_TANCI|nr:hypothetical protein [Tanacetum cinerariifolium]
MVTYTAYRVVKLLVKFATTHMRTSSNPRTHANIQDGRVVVQIIQVRQAQGYSSNVGKGKGTGNTRVGKGIMPNSVQQRRGLGILNGFDSDCKELQLNATSILMTEKVDAYDSEVNDAPTASAIFMAKLSPLVLLIGMKLVRHMIQIFYPNFLSDTNVISDNPYLDDNENEVVQVMNSLSQNDVAIFLLIENMKHEVIRCNTINLKSKQVNE